MTDLRAALRAGTCSSGRARPVYSEPMGSGGIAGRDLSAPLAVDLAIAAAQVLARPDGGAARAVAVIGRDPSSSGQFLESAIIAGLTSSGVDVITNRSCAGRRGGILDRAA